MMRKRYPRARLVKVLFGCLLAIFGGIGVIFGGTEVVYAEPVEGVEAGENGEVVETEENNENEENTETAATTGQSCESSLGALGWLVCPGTGKIAEAVDWLYDKIEDILIINPVKMEDGEPIYEIWKYFRGITNIMFMIFLLVVIYSQITGVGITNYGLKKTLPKLIIAAILVNLSFLICSLAVDVSNIVGEGLRGVFDSISTATTGSMTGAHGVTTTDMYLALSGGTAMAVGAGVIAFETGAIWMLIPTVLGAVVAVVVGLITIALRQAVVALLVMISPLAMVAYILPNTEQWFKKWRELLTKMLVFYPMFSLLFGASSLAGWAIIVSAQDGFGVMLGIAVQIFPLFFSWSLMKMSGTFLSTINSKLSGLASAPVAGVRGWADSHRELARQGNLARGDAYMPSLRLRQYLNNRKVMREAGTKEAAELNQNRGLAYAARKGYEKDGKTPSRMGMGAYEMQARNMQYQRETLRFKNDMNKGLGQLEAVKNGGNVRLKAQLAELDAANVKASDALKVEQARTEKIDYDNAAGFHRRMEDAINSHMDQLHASEPTYKRHLTPGTADATRAAERYAVAADIMEGDVQNVQYAAATAAHAYDTQAKVYQTRMQKYFELAPPTKDVVFRLDELTKKYTAAQNIDAIIPGLRVLAMRGDTDLIREQLDNILKYSRYRDGIKDDELKRLIEENSNELGVHLGTHASQALASFLMFDVGDKDPTLKRLGKYINLETAHAYNKNVRKNTRLTLEEYLKGYYEEYDPETGRVEQRTPSRGMVTLLEGTSLDNVERTAYRNLDEMLMEAYKREDGSVDVPNYLKRREEIETAMGPQFISASLKYLSGSEQLKSAVDFLTGRNKGKERWAPGGELAATEEDAKFAKAYFQRKTLQYFMDQTPTQILGLRSDYRDPVAEHLLSALFEDHPELQTEYNAEVSRIQTLYGDEDAETAEKKRRKDIQALRMRLAGNEVRTILDKSGKLEQIYRTRRSGAANNAKDWLRDWLLLNDEGQIYRYLDRKQEERGENPEIQVGDGGLPGEKGERARARNTGIMDLTYDKYKDKDENIFRQEARNNLVTFAGEGILTALFDKYIKDHRGAIDNHDLNEAIKGWLCDPGNYQ